MLYISIPGVLKLELERAGQIARINLEASWLVDPKFYPVFIPKTRYLNFVCEVEKPVFEVNTG